MKTLFCLGIAPRNYWMGDTSVDRDKLVADVDAAQTKLSTIQDWLQKRPNYQAILGSDASRFDGMMQSIRGAYDTITTVYQRLSSPNADAWRATDNELAQLNGFIGAVNEMTSIIAAHPQTASQPIDPTGLASGTVLPPGTLLKPGTVLPPGVTIAPAGASMANVSQPSSSATPWLVGGGLALFGFLLVSALK